MKRFILLLLPFAVVVLAQNEVQKTNSFFEASEARTFALQSLVVEGEVERPGVVDLNSLPLRSFPVRETALENGKPAFKGAFYYSGYSLYDILNGQTVRKARENNFNPFVDLYVVVENARGEKAAFSWGEIYYSKDNFSVLISRSVQGIDPSKLSIKWTLPSEPRLICGKDQFNFRFLSNPAKISVRSTRGAFATEKPKDLYAPEFQIVTPAQTVTVREIGTAIEKRKYGNVGYGHGTGFKGFESAEGFLFKDLLQSKVKLGAEDMRQSIAVISARDGYRCVFSASEILNRNDNQDFLLADRKDSREDGRFVLFAAPDFFVDRNVKAIEKVEFQQVK